MSSNLIVSATFKENFQGQLLLAFFISKDRLNGKAYPAIGVSVQVVYLILCIFGLILPFSQFVPWLSLRGLDIPLLLQEATSTHISAFAWADVLVSGIAVAIFIIIEGRKLRMGRLWLPLLCMMVGPSLALPLFLFLRERHLYQTNSITN